MGEGGDRLRKQALAVGLGAFVATGLVACSSPHTTPPITTSSSPTSTTSTPSTTTTSATPVCSAGNLAVTLLGTQGAAGTFEMTFALRNSGASACGLNGFPGVQLVDASGANLPDTVVRAGNYSFTNFAPSPVTLVPGATAYINLAYSDVPTGSESTCPTAAQVKVLPPGAGGADAVAAQMVVCNAGTVTVSPVFGAGSAASGTTAPPGH